MENIQKIKTLGVLTLETFEPQPTEILPKVNQFSFD